MKILKYKSLLYFISLNYIDKGLAFLLPLFVLYFTKNISLYNDIEYIFSIANIMVVVLDLGGRAYMLYGYVNIQDKKKYLEGVKGFFYILNFFYILLVLAILLTCTLTSFINNIIFFISIRCLIVLFINYFSVYFRLLDKPQNILYISILINSLTILILFILNKFITNTNGVYYFFSVQMLFIVLVSIKEGKYINKSSILFSMDYLKKAIKYSWPVILNVLLITIMNNFGKIYIFQRFSKEEMYTFSYLLRISMVIQMAHVSISAYYSKKIYLDSTTKIDFRLYKFYSLFLFSTVLLCLMMIFVINTLNFLPKIDLGVTAIFLLLYVFIWCQQSYFEQYLNKTNRNKWILYISCISMIIYFFLLFNPLANITVNYISFCMAISVLVSFVLLLFCLKKIKLI